MIKIVSTDAFHQYDEDGRAITTWDGKKCAWIVNQEFENEEIDWWGKDNDFPRGQTLKSFIESNPDWDKNPDISVTWTWNSKLAMMISCGNPTSYKESEWYEKTKFPYSESRQWGYLDYTKEEAIEKLGKYCGFHKGADKVTITYNNEVIHDGKLV